MAAKKTTSTITHVNNMTTIELAVMGASLCCAEAVNEKEAKSATKVTNFENFVAIIFFLLAFLVKMIQACFKNTTKLLQRNLFHSLNYSFLMDLLTIFKNCPKSFRLRLFFRNLRGINSLIIAD
jgi:hypothetical protein